LTKLPSPFSVYLNGKAPQDKALKAFAKGCGGQVYEQGKALQGGIPVFAGLFTESMGRIKQCKRDKRPFIFLDHAYFDRGYQYGNFRVCVSGVYTNHLLDVPNDRVRVDLKPWRQGRDVVVLAPSENVCEAIGASKRWAHETAEEVKRYTSRPVVVKTKGDKWPEDIHCVVSLASVAEVEAAVRGIPVFATEHSPASQIAERDFTKIETPIYPDRSQWLRTLSYSQWNVGEMAVGQLIRHLERVLDEHQHIRRATDGSSQLGG
jgi:hypothetical protein